MRSKATNSKLVRDLIPQIIIESGRNPTFYHAESAEYETALSEKLLEEIEEFKADKSIEEMADILEVIDALVEFYKFDQHELQQCKLRKKLERGGFKDRIILAF